MEYDLGNMLSTHIIIIFALFIISSIAYACEKALHAANKNQLKLLAEQDKKSAITALDKIENEEKFISGIQTITTFSSILASVFIVNDFLNKFSNFIYNKNVPFSHIISMLLLSLIMVGIFLVFVKLLPAQIAKKNPTKVLLATVKFVSFICTIMKPLSFLLDIIVKGIMVIFGLNKIIETEEFSEEEIIEMLEVGQETGQIKETGMEMISSIFEFDDKFAYEVMTPRTDCYMIDIEDPSESYLDEMLETRYSRIPVYEGDSDNIIGVLNIKDFLVEAREKGFENVSIKELIRKPYFVPETKKIDDLFKEMQENKSSVAFLIDEYGGFAGLVTIKDIVEEVMGQLDDEYHEEDIKISKIANNTYLVDGMFDLDDLNEELSINLESEEHETIGGFVLENLDDLPDENNINQYCIIKDNIELRIQSIKDRRIERVKLIIHSKNSETEENA